MKNYLTVAASLLAGATLMLAAVPATAATTVDVNIGVPGVVVQPRPVYVQPRTVFVQPDYDREWGERRVRAVEWRDNPQNHGHAVSAAAHDRNDVRKHKKHKNKNKHKNKHGH